MGRRLPDARTCGSNVPPGAMLGMAETTGSARRRVIVAGITDGQPSSISSSVFRPTVLQGNIEKVYIRWNMILGAAAEMLGGTEPVYTRERGDGYIQARVSFRAPLGKDRAVFEDVEAVGMRCFEEWEAESTAALSALRQLEARPFCIRILDVSRLRYEEMQKSCYQHLLKTGEVCRGIKLLLSDWDDTMAKTEDCYRGLHEELVENACRGVNGAYSEIVHDAANCMYSLTRASYLKFAKLAAEAEETKAIEWDVRGRAEHHFHDRCHHRVDTEQREMKLCMKKILDEMVKSLGWDEPMYKFNQRGADMYDCEVSLVWKSGELREESKKTLFTAGKGRSQDEAVENTCENAVLLLEKELSVCLVDINYNKRAHAELYLSEACEVLNLADAISTKIISEWESMVDGLQTREKQCWDVVTQHPEKEPWNQLYNAKCEVARVVADLHGACLSDLIFAKERQYLLSTWLDQQAQGW